MKRKFTITVLGVLSVLLPSVALAQEYGIPRIAFEDDSESQIVIRVRSDRTNLCGSGVNLSRLGIEDYNFPRSGRSTSYDFPRPSGSVNYFQLPVGAKNPDIIGCVDTQRNIVFINILKPQVKEQPAPEPTRQPVPQVQSESKISPNQTVPSSWNPNQYQK